MVGTNRYRCTDGVLQFWEDYAKTHYDGFCNPDTGDCVSRPTPAPAPTPKPKPTPKQTPYSGACKHTCVSNLDGCTGGGVKVSGNCSAGKVCCYYPI